ncbi:MAG: host attachment protein [Alphaproteobacteria bacterium]|nr:host attachment protein [Alphaproteobacteria bacterium]
MMKRPTIWVVIADGSRARIVVPTERKATYATIRSFDSPDSRLPARELGRAALGRTQESATPSRHGIEPRSDPHDRLQKEFAGEVAEALNGASESGMFDRLVLVAPQSVAAPLRHALDEAVRHKIAEVIAKDLTKTPDHELAAHLEAVERIR